MLVKDDEEREEWEGKEAVVEEEEAAPAIINIDQEPKAAAAEPILYCNLKSFIKLSSLMTSILSFGIHSLFIATHHHRYHQCHYHLHSFIIIVFAVGIIFSS